MNKLDFAKGHFLCLCTLSILWSQDLLQRGGGDFFQNNRAFLISFVMTFKISLVPPAFQPRWSPWITSCFRKECFMFLTKATSRWCIWRGRSIHGNLIHFWWKSYCFICKSLQILLFWWKYLTLFTRVNCPCMQYSYQQVIQNPGSN